MCSRGWGYRCPSAKGTRCTCKCGGVCHGKARDMSKADFKEQAKEDPLFYMGAEDKQAHRPTTRGEVS